MANLLNRFKKEVIGSDGKIYDYLAKVTASGNFKRIRDIDVIISSWNNILLTPRRTYLYDPEYGSDLHLMIFEPADDSTVERIKDEIEQSIGYYDDRAIITDITVKIMSNGKGFTADIHAEYEGEEASLKIKFDDSTVLSQVGDTGVPIP
ncbi:MAG: GPW/gp25 family protein [Candidatus Thorarchaeota archaeon]